MTTAQQSKLILIGIDLERQIADLTREYEQIKDQFRQEAAHYLFTDRIVSASDAWGLAGNNFTFGAEDGSSCRVSFPRAGLVREIRFVKDVAHKLDDKKVLIPLGGNPRKLTGDSFDKLFQESFKPAKAFRELVLALLGPAKAEQLISLVQTPPTVGIVKFDVKEKAA